jgi:hypothetical protein
VSSLNGSTRVVTDAAGETWVAWETASPSVAVHGGHAVRPSPWISFTSQKTGRRLSGFAAHALDEMSDSDLLRLLQEMLKRESR